MICAASALAFTAGCSKQAEASFPYLTVGAKAAYDVKEDHLDTAGAEIGLKGNAYGGGVEYLDDQATKSYNLNAYRYFGNPYILVGGGYQESKIHSDKTVHYGVGYQNAKALVSPKIELRHIYKLNEKNSDVVVVGGLEFRF